MKQKVYIIAFTILGGLLGFLIHGLMEIWYVRLLASNFDQYGYGFDYATWIRIHNISALILFVGGLYSGYRGGRHWWKVLYVDHKFRKYFKKSLKQNF